MFNDVIQYHSFFSNLKSTKKREKEIIDRDRTRTCNPQIRSLMPYPLGHTTLLTKEVISAV